MGSINSVPVVSQVKSLVQVIAGDETGAKQTQEEFARTAIIVSQFNSLGHSIVVKKCQNIFNFFPDMLISSIYRETMRKH